MYRKNEYNLKTPIEISKEQEEDSISIGKPFYLASQRDLKKDYHSVQVYRQNKSGRSLTPQKKIFSKKNIYQNKKKFAIKEPEEIIFKFEEQNRKEKLNNYEKIFFEISMKNFINLTFRTKNLKLIEDIITTKMKKKLIEPKISVKDFTYCQRANQELLKLRIEDKKLDFLDLNLDIELKNLEGDYLDLIENNMVKNLEDSLFVRAKILNKYPNGVLKEVDEALLYTPDFILKITKDNIILKKEILDFNKIDNKELKKDFNKKIDKMRHLKKTTKNYKEFYHSYIL